MRIKRILKILLFISCVVAPGWAESAAQKLETAWKAEDSKSAQACYAPGIWETEADGGKGLFRQLVRKKLEFRLVREHVAKNRVVAVYDVWRKGRRVDRVFTFLVDEKVWAHTENKSHAVHFFDGKTPPRLELSDLTGSSELDTLGRKFLEGESTGQAKLDGALKAEALEFSSSHLLENLGRALLVYGDKEYAIVLERDGKIWKAIDHTYLPRATSMLPKIPVHPILVD